MLAVGGDGQCHPAGRQGDLASLAGEGSIFGGSAAEKLERLLAELEPLSCRYDVVVANPPYMGSSSLGKWMGAWVKKHYPEAYRDLCTGFIDRGFALSAADGYSAMVTMQSWMFLGSFEKLRGKILRNHLISSMAHLGTRAFGAIAGEVVSTTATVFANVKSEVKGAYFRLVDMGSEEEKQAGLLESLANPDCGWFYRADASGFEAIPGSPIAYWLKKTLIRTFRNERTLIENVESTASGNKTADNDLYIRYWYEVAHTSKRWVPLSKGGEFRKWYGNWLNVIDWSDEAKHFYQTNKTSNLMPYSSWFVEGITWSDISSGKFHCRYAPSGVTSETVGPIFAISKHIERNCTMALLNSSFADTVFELLAPGLHFKITDIGKLPCKEAVTNNSTLSSIVDDNINLARIDWNAFETSHGFKRHPLT